MGYYGEKCKKCPDNCLNGNCHIQIGHCFDCKDGFKDDRCEKGIGICMSLMLYMELNTLFFPVMLNILNIL